MATTEKRTGSDGKPRYVVRYRNPAGKTRSKTFTRRVDADRYRAGIEHSLITGTWVDPSRSRITVRDWSQRWLAIKAKQVKPSTLSTYRQQLDKHVLPRWGDAPLSAVEHTDVAEWVAGIDLSPSSVRYVHRVLYLLLELAVRDRRITSNPAAGVQLPTVQPPEKRFLTFTQVQALADAAANYPIPEVGGQYRALILLLSMCGLRWGEAAALKVKRVDLLRRRLTVAESATEVRGRLVWGTPKSHQSRSVPIPKTVAAALAEAVAGKGPDDLVFTTWQRKPLRNLNFRRDVFDKAAADAGLDGLTPHELRHTAASLAIAAGANVKAVQRMLGHKSARMTLDVYAGLFEDDLDGVADRMDSLSAVSPACHEASVTSLSSEPKSALTRGGGGAA